MMRHNLPADAWTKSSYSGDNGGQCLEKQMMADGCVAAGDSKNRELGAHAFRQSVWQEFVTAAAEGTL